MNTFSQCEDEMVNVKEPTVRVYSASEKREMLACKIYLDVIDAIYAAGWKELPGYISPLPEGADHIKAQNDGIAAVRKLLEMVEVYG